MTLRGRLLAAIVVALLGFGWAPAGAVEPSEVLSDAVLETRARAISKGLRCIVCQNQSIDESDADLARDLRVLVRERLTAGDSDSEVVDYIVSRYGDFVLLKPPFKGATLLLWLGPVLIAVAGMAGIVTAFRRRSAAAAASAPLSADEKRRLEALLNDDGDT